MFIWLDLSGYLAAVGCKDDGWAAEEALSKRLREEGILLATGKQYSAPDPGHFRLIHCVPEDHLRKGIERYGWPTTCRVRISAYCITTDSLPVVFYLRFTPNGEAFSAKKPYDIYHRPSLARGADKAKCSVPPCAA